MATTACVKDAPKPSGDAPSGEVAVWDFPPEPGESTTLFPPDIGAPQRLKRHLGTRVEQERLLTVVEDRDPQLGWQFDKPGRAFAVHVEFEASEPGMMQVFWATPRCPVYSEPCSATASFGAGRQIVEWMLDPTDPLRELRLDPPDHLGAKVAFDRIAVRRTPALAGMWQPNGITTDLVMTPSGLDVEAIAADPWMVLPTPGLEAKAVSAVELIVRGPHGEVPQLYWKPVNGAFSERCAVRLTAVDGGALTHRGVLKRHPCWTGRIELMRLDPGQNPGHYVVERLALVQNKAD